MPPPDLILTNARVLTMDARMPSAEVLAVSGGRIAWVGTADGAAALRGANTRAVDCGGASVVPGFHDAHMHILAYAASLDAADCGPSRAASIGDIQRVIQTAAARVPEGEWVRGRGYDHEALAESRHPTRRDLDKAAPRHPVRLTHRSGHADVLNSLALARAGIADSTPEPPGATISRSLEDGAPDGLLLEMGEYLDAKIPPPPYGVLRGRVARAARNLLAFGITSAQDATHTNGADRWDLLATLRQSVRPMPRITMMAGGARLSEFAERGMGFGFGDNRLRLGHAKLMATASDGRQNPPPSELRRIAAACARAGFPAAIHAVESEIVASAADAIANAPKVTGARHRIEHCAECPPAVLDAAARCGAAVATQPAFIHESGDRYLRTVARGALPHLYRTRSLAERGIPLGFGSDAPVANPNPTLGLQAAATRRSATGAPLSERERMTVTAALSAYTRGSAKAAGESAARELGALTPGRLADIAVLDRDISAISPDEIGEARVVMTIIGGATVWEG